MLKRLFFTLLLGCGAANTPDVSQQAPRQRGQAATPGHVTEPNMVVRAPSGDLRRHVMPGRTVAIPVEWTPRPPRGPLVLAEFAAGTGERRLEVAFLRAQFGVDDTDASASTESCQRLFGFESAEAAADATEASFVAAGQDRVTLIQVTGNRAVHQPIAPATTAQCVATTVPSDNGGTTVRYVGPADVIDVWQPTLAKIAHSLTHANGGQLQGSPP